MAVAPWVRVLMVGLGRARGVCVDSGILSFFVLCLPLGPVSIMGMLTIATDILPQTQLSYVAFRVAFQDTLERVVLAKQMGERDTSCFGFLTEVSFLRAVAPHVQLDLLAETWAKHMAQEPVEADLVDESVVYAACETSAAVAEHDPSAFCRYLKNGPLNIELAADAFLAAELRGLHANFTQEADFLVISQFQDLEPDEARRLKWEFGLDELRLEALFEVLGLWTMSADFLNHLDGLLTKRELARAVTILGTD